MTAATARRASEFPLGPSSRGAGGLEVSEYEPACQSGAEPVRGCAI